jgi:uncharacterized glyoxalase superfamily metalloenzyme YdcJ
MGGRRSIHRLREGETEPKMIARTSKTKTGTNDDVLAAFVQSKAEIDAMLARLQALSDEHFNYSPDEIDWGHVGSLGYYAELLKRVTDSAFHEGEHA